MGFFSKTDRNLYSKENENSLKANQTFFILMNYLRNLNWQKVDDLLISARNIYDDNYIDIVLKKNKADLELTLNKYHI